MTFSGYYIIEATSGSRVVHWIASHGQSPALNLGVQHDRNAPFSHPVSSSSFSK